QSRRAPGENTKRVSFGYAGAAFALVDYSPEGVLPVEVQEEASNGPGIDLSAGTIGEVSAIMALLHHKSAADIARNAASQAANNKVTLSGSDQWSDPPSDPLDDIEVAKEAVRAAPGKRPNTVVLGAL